MIALTTDTSILTAIGNDYGYEKLFARQVQAHAREGDVFIAYSTSGKSPNVIAALQEARSRGVVCVGMTGNRGGPMKELCDHYLDVPSADTPKIQKWACRSGPYLVWPGRTCTFQSARLMEAIVLAGGFGKQSGDGEEPLDSRRPGHIFAFSHTPQVEVEKLVTYIKGEETKSCRIDRLMTMMLFRKLAFIAIVVSS